MSRAAYLESLQHRLETLESRMSADRKRLAEGSPRDKVAAAGDLALVESRLAETREKLARLEAEPEGSWEGFKTEVEQDFDYLEREVERLIERPR
ncbi:hypothetical protein SAMN06265365_1077 [Tistlia consotensis]|uniref:Uncharacterized protein n=1 Tax=Tistlia consotensis USBA 355 TaxID=560819 RepID=A0A1Y6B9P0_9PROT|nr:hypothetical protein [Tistlia consotensis]SME96627.1 hypothetical protein SAMN05428998_1027 [Tistlia consotensis USBA 355]SNR55957.1 hypothetical protein SAMN06265365_1077 [Tistlia consotensis]